MKNIAVIQARMGSTRLPGKVMLPLDGVHVLTHVVNRIRSSSRVDDVIIATSDEKTDDVIAQYSNRGNVAVFRGSETDVLDRMFKTAEKRDADAVA
jgi:spore coat polysaccharide biosynthesis protein SpsF